MKLFKKAELTPEEVKNAIIFLLVLLIILAIIAWRFWPALQSAFSNMFRR